MTFLFIIVLAFSKTLFFGSLLPEKSFLIDLIRKDVDLGIYVADRERGILTLSFQGKVAALP